MPDDRRRFDRRALILLAIVAIGAAAAGLWAGADLWHPRALVARLGRLAADLGPWGPLAYIAFYAASPFLLVPAIPLTIAGGALFGASTGALCALVGSALGASFSFLAGRALGHEALAHHAHGRILSIKAGIEEEGWRFVAFLRLVPVLPFGIANMLLGTTDLRFSTYLLTTMLTMLPGLIALTWAGAEGRAVANGTASTLAIGGAVVGLVVLISGIPAAVRYARRARASDRP